MTPSSDASPARALDANGEPTTESGSVTAVASSTDAPISHEDIAATDAAAAARVFRNASRAESTWRAYEHDWRVFVHWCVGNGHDPLPASPRTLEMFRATQAMPASGRAPYSLSTIERRRAAVRLMHLGAGHPSPHASPEVVELMRGDELFREQAERRVRLGLVVGEIIQRRELRAEAAAVRAQVERLASAYQDPQEVVDHYYSNPELLRNIEGLVLEEAVTSTVLEAATVTDEPTSFKEIMNPPQTVAGEEETEEHDTAPDGADGEGQGESTGSGSTDEANSENSENR